MGKPTGFKEIARETPKRRSVELRLADWQEVYIDFSKENVSKQAARCMDCGIPFCHGPTGCPLGNIIPEWNDLVYKDRWHEALDMLHKTNNFPEFTGRVCPAPCEEACTLNITEHPVTIKTIEQNIADVGWANGWIKPEPPEKRTGKKVAVIGSGPAGLGCAQQLNRAGHETTVYERADRIGGLLIYGIPNFKLEKHLVERRVDQMKAEGVKFVTNANVGVNVKVEDLQKNFDAIVLCGGATKPRDLQVPGRELQGIHYAMDYLPQQNKVNLGDTVQNQIDAKDKAVIIIGGGDTGADCLGTALRQKAKSIIQFELLPKPPESRQETSVAPWPNWPIIFRTSSAHEEAALLCGGKDCRDFAINTSSFTGENGVVKKLNAVRLEWFKGEGGRMQMRPMPGSEFTLDCDLCFLAMGFVGPEQPGPIQQLKLDLDPRGNVKVAENYMTNVKGIFAAGDLRRGQSLVVWAISEGRQAARAVDEYLMGRSELPYIRLF
ncbi:MAG TPA: glutamate synthase subunit beta [Tepidisphaeraceae bacterium]|jgi:glutamate synthase (NADPH/NADH) small chain